MNKILPLLIIILILSGCSLTKKQNLIQETIINSPEMKIKEHFISEDQYPGMWVGNTTWYYYSLTYPKLWIKLSFKDDFASFFTKKTDLNQIYKYNNSEINIYSTEKKISPFIKMYNKDKNISLKEAINLDNKELIKNNCYLLETERWIWEEKYFPWKDIEIINIDMSTENLCSLFSDYEWMAIWYVMNKKFHERYYMFYYANWCAPSCEMPQLEIFEIK